MSLRTIDPKSHRIFALLCDVELGKQPALTSEERAELVYMQRRISWSKARMEKVAAQVAIVKLPQPCRATMTTGWELLVRRVVGMFDELTNALVSGGNSRIRIRMHAEQ